MRAVVRAYLAGHPLLTLGLLIGRWLLWMVAGHPVALVVGVIALVLNRSVPSAAVFAALVDGLVFFIGSIWLTGPARMYWVWTQGARFRRRWPSAFAEAYIQPEFDRAAVFPGNYYSAPDGLRPVLVAPRVSLLPRRLTWREMRWAVRPWSAQGFGEIAAQAGRLAQADDRVVRADVVRRKHNQRRRWDLVVAFSDRAVDPDGGSSISGDGYKPAANGGGPDLVSPTHRRRRSKPLDQSSLSRSSANRNSKNRSSKNRSSGNRNSGNGSSSSGHFGAVQSSGKGQAKEPLRVVHDVRYRKKSWNE